GVPAGRGLVRGSVAVPRCAAVAGVRPLRPDQAGRSHATGLRARYRVGLQASALLTPQLAIAGEARYLRTHFSSTALMESTTPISPDGLTAITCASPNSPGPVPALPVAARTVPLRSIRRIWPANP